MRNLLIALTLSAALNPLAHAAADPDMNVDANDVALRGYDAVAYFNAGKPTEGRPEFTATHKGAIFRFVSAENRDAFKKDPMRYAPQFGGWCAYAASVNGKGNTDPQAWQIVDGKLYLNYSKDVHARWQTDVPGKIKAGSLNWPAIKDLPAEEVNAKLRR